MGKNSISLQSILIGMIPTLLMISNLPYSYIRYSIYLILIGIVCYLIVKNGIRITSRVHPVFFLATIFFLFYIFEFLRSMSANLFSQINVLSISIRLFIILIILYVLGSSIRSSNELKNILFNTVLISNLFIALNIILFVLGFYTASLFSYASVLAQLGISLPRIEFALFSSLQVSGFFVSCAVLGSYACYRAKIYRSLMILFIIQGFIFLTLADVRGSIFLTLASIAALNIFRLYSSQRKNNRRMLLLIGVIIMPIVAPLFFGLLSGFSRIEGSVLTGREYIWSQALLSIANFDIQQLLFGFGAWGQTISGISNSYLDFFINRDSAELATLHNIFLQVLIDGGLPLLVILCLLFIWATFFLWRSFFNSKINENTKHIYDLMLEYVFLIHIYVFFYGFFDTSGLPYNPSGFYNFLFAYFLIQTIFKNENFTIKHH